MTWIFAYGSNMDLEHLEHWLDNEQVEGNYPYRGCRIMRFFRAQLPGYALVFNYRRGGNDYKSGTGASNVQTASDTDPFTSVWGIVIEVDDLTERGINRKEGYRPNNLQDSSYLRKTENVILDDGTSIPAEIYHARITEPRHISPLQEYKQFILNGATRFLLPQDYVRWLESIVSRETEIQRKAYFLWLQRNGEHGFDWHDWFSAERDLREANPRHELTMQPDSVERQARSTPMKNPFASLPSVYVDESGYAGDNLLHTPLYFSLASISLPDDVAKSLMQPLVAATSGEPKHEKLKASAEGVSLISALFDGLAPYSENAFLYIVEKRYALLALLFEFWLEPYLTEHTNVKYYEGGFNQINVDIAYFLIPICEGNDDFWLPVLKTFSDAMREPKNQGKFDEFTKALEKLFSTCDAESKNWLQPLVSSAKKYGLEHQSKFTLPRWGPQPLDIVFTAELAVANFWSLKLDSEFLFVHDESSSFSKMKGLWDAFLSNDTGKQNFVSPDGETWRYPFKIKETKFVKSDDSPQAQIADILAGTICDYFSSETKFAAKSMSYISNDLVSKIENMTLGGLLFDESRLDEAKWQQMKRSTGDASLKFVTGVIDKHRESKKKR